MKKFLIFVEDPGVTNMILDFPVLFSNLNNSFEIIANSFAAEILKRNNVSFTRVNKEIELIKFLNEKIFDFYIVGTSENKNTLALELIKIAKRKKILSIGLIDMLANYQYRFSGNTNNPLYFRPDKLIVTDENTKNSFIGLGFEKENIYICLHPQEDRIKKIKNQFINRGKNIFNKKKRWLFIAENTDLLNPQESFLSKDYSLRGLGKSKWRTGIVLEEIIENIKTFNPKPNLVVRLHPKNNKSQFLTWSKDIIFDQILDPLESVWNSDVVIGMSSNLLVEANLLGKPVYSVLTRKKEREWMFELKSEKIISVYNRKDLKNLLNNIFNGNYPKVKNNENSISKMSMISILKNFV